MWGVWLKLGSVFFFPFKFKGIVVYREGMCYYIFSQEVKIEIGIFPPFHSERIISCVYYVPESVDLCCMCSWPRGNGVRSMNFMFHFQNGKSTFILRFSGVDSVAEQVATFALWAFSRCLDSFIFCWNSVRSWLCRGMQDLGPVEILCVRTKAWVEVCLKWGALQKVESTGTETGTQQQSACGDVVSFFQDSVM